MHHFGQKLEGPENLEVVIYEELRGEGCADYFVLLFPFFRLQGPVREGGFQISMLFDKPGSIFDEELEELESILAIFAISARSAGTYATAQIMASRYLDHDAGQRVIDGDIDHGIVLGFLGMGC